MSLRLAIAGVVLIAFLALGALYYRETAKTARLEAENAALTRSVAVLEHTAAQSRAAAKVAKAYAERAEQKALEYERVKDAFRTGDFDDVALPDDFRRLLDRILRRPGR